MPYITQDARWLVDEKIDELVENFRKDIGWGNTGAANYVITRVILGCMKPTDKWNYSSLSDVIKSLECSKLEIYRRLVAPYEDKCIDKNCDLQEFTN